jgi:hypothetical protein
MMATNSEAITVKAPALPQGFTMQTAPEIVLEEAARAAKALQQVIDSKPKKVVLNGKLYPEYEDWQTIGKFYGITAGTVATKFVQMGAIRGYEAVAEARDIRTDQRMSSAEAMCLSDEPNWAKKPLFQLRSMAQTRACAKAMRNVLGWVVVLAGYEPTPKEELEEGSAPAPKAEVVPEKLRTIDPKEMKQRLNEIANAKSMEGVKGVWSKIENTTWKKAQAIGDSIAMKELEKAAGAKYDEFKAKQAEMGQPLNFEE